MRTIKKSAMVVNGTLIRMFACEKVQSPGKCPRKGIFPMAVSTAAPMTAITMA